MTGVAGTSKVALAVAAFLASLSLVTWRQGEALDASRDLEALRQESLLEAATREELENRIRELESRSRVVREAQRRLGLREPEDSEVVSLQWEDA